MSRRVPPGRRCPPILAPSLCIIALLSVSRSEAAQPTFETKGMVEKIVTKLPPEPLFWRIERLPAPAQETPGARSSGCSRHAAASAGHRPGPRRGDEVLVPGGSCCWRSTPRRCLRRATRPTSSRARWASRVPGCASRRGAVRRRRRRVRPRPQAVNTAPSKRSIVANVSTGSRRSFVTSLRGTPRKIVATRAWSGGRPSSGAASGSARREERRDDATEPAGPGGQQDAPAERVDRRPARDRDAADRAVHQGDAAQVGGDGQHDRDPLDRVDQGVRRVRHVRRLAVVDDVVRRDPELGPGHVAVPDRLHQRPDAPADRRVLDDRDAPGLAVAAARREAGVVEEVTDHRPGDRLVGEVARRGGGAQHGAGVHRRRSLGVPVHSPSCCARRNRTDCERVRTRLRRPSGARC